MKTSVRASRMEPSATLAVVNKAKALKYEGKPVISFGAGEPDFDSPAAAASCAESAIKEGKTHYTQSNGILELREAVASYYSDRFGLDYPADQVIIGPGAKPLIYGSLASLVDPEDEVLVFSPAWVSYVEQIRLLDGRASIVDTVTTGNVPLASKVAEAVTPRTVGMLINTPNNPTGAVYGEETLREIAEIALEHDLWIINDEIYERLVYGNSTHLNIATLVPEVADRTIQINGVSKAFAMTGWRIGYALAPKWLSPKIGAIQGHLTSNACTIAQWASLGALKGAEEDVVRMRDEFARRRAIITDLLKEMPLVSFSEPQGAFYVFLNVAGALGGLFNGKKLEDDATFCEALLETEYVAAVPGTAFLAPGHIRLSYANSEAEIREGMARLKRFLGSIEV
ncbi:MAG: pyridoxal phosphate-dependent aminotransferase [Synergistaceae bacterium]|nr:pyridoxal phosphate-dependent aminotransferase [Synergistales bacterium]MBP8995448.1 pyridoxal phosphate-dependent aminotransferase [Synergistales bacterium]NMD17136.1 pyridoxal phosphate-dependent aminotransferase [Synergistaceae bacterium]